MNTITFIFMGRIFGSVPVAYATTDTDIVVYIAKQKIADTLIKMGMLTDSLPDKAHRNPKIAGMQMADELVPTFDQFIKEGVC